MKKEERQILMSLLADAISFLHQVKLNRLTSHDKKKIQALRKVLEQTIKELIK